MLVFVLCAILNHASGSEITFTSSPPTITPIATQAMTLTCSLTNTVTSSIGGLVGKRDVTKTDSDVKLVTSLVIMKSSGEHIATLTQISPPTALVADKSGLTVTGNITDAGRSVLSLTWAFPDDRHTGDYICEVNGMTEQGHNVVFSKHMEVGVTELSLRDLVHYTRDHILLGQQQDARLHQLEALTTQQAAQIANMTQHNAELTHIETGSISCSESYQWTEAFAGGSSTETHSLTFQKPYHGAPPIVYLSVYYVDSLHDRNIRYAVLLDNVDARGFKMRCQRWALNSSRLWGLTVQWISFPQ